MAGFDPKAYVAQVDGQGSAAFDPKAYVEASGLSVPPAQPTSKLDEFMRGAKALGRGAAQGATLGFGDELAGAYNAASTSPAEWLYAKLHPGEPAPPSFQDRYAQGRDEARALNA